MKYRFLYRPICWIWGHAMAPSEVREDPPHWKGYTWTWNRCLTCGKPDPIPLVEQKPIPGEG